MPDSLPTPDHVDVGYREIADQLAREALDSSRIHTDARRAVIMQGAQMYATLAQAEAADAGYLVDQLREHLDLDTVAETVAVNLATALAEEFLPRPRPTIPYLIVTWLSRRDR